jgi:hypothetical protein
MVLVLLHHNHRILIFFHNHCGPVTNLELGASVGDIALMSVKSTVHSVEIAGPGESKTWKMNGDVFFKFRDYDKYVSRT